MSGVAHSCMSISDKGIIYTGSANSSIAGQMHCLMTQPNTSRDSLASCVEVCIFTAPASLFLVHRFADAPIHLFGMGHGNSRGLHHEGMLQVCEVCGWQVQPLTGDQVALV